MASTDRGVPEQKPESARESASQADARARRGGGPRRVERAVPPSAPEKRDA